MKEFFSLVVAFLGFVNLLGAEPPLKPGTRIVTLGDSITQAGGYQRLMRRVFDRFYTGTAYSYQQKGTGLGISITRLVVERFGGTVEFDSKYKSGARCLICLPQPTDS